MGVGSLKEKGRAAAEKMMFRLFSKCWREATLDWCCRYSITGFKRAYIGRGGLVSRSGGGICVRRWRFCR